MWDRLVLWNHLYWTILCDFSGQTNWKLKICWIKALYDPATKICSTNKLLNAQINRIRIFMSWKRYPRYVRNIIIKHLQQKKISVQKDDESVIQIWIRLPYLGNKGEELVKTWVRKLTRCFKTNVKFVTLYDTKKCSRFCSVKNKISTHQKSNVIYTIKCPWCGEDYVRKTDRYVTPSTLWEVFRNNNIIAITSYWYWCKYCQLTCWHC